MATLYHYYHYLLLVAMTLPSQINCSIGTSNYMWRIGTGSEDISSSPLNDTEKLNSTLAMLCSNWSTHSAESVMTTDTSASGTCPAWFYAANVTTGCKCGSSLGGRIYCNDTLREIKIRSCHCMTYDELTMDLVMGACAYNCFFYKNVTVLGTQNSYRQFYNVPKNVIGKEMCDPHNRQGRMCGSCKQGYAPPIYSYDLRCVKCNSTDYSWAKYVAVAFLPLTVFFYAVVALGISATSPSMNAFILISQALATPAFVRTMIAFLEFRSSEYSILLRILFTVYGIWNLDFFRTLIPPFCLPVNTLQTLAMDYAVAFYPMVLIVVTYVVVELHAHNVRVVVLVWKPFHRCLARFRRHWNMKTSLVEAFATFLLLSFIKCMSVSFALLVPTHLYNVYGERVSASFLFYDATVEVFGEGHLPYAILAIAVLFLVIILPLLVLLMYPLKTTQKCLNRCSLNSVALHTFSDAFQGSFKDGTNGTRDCRYFAVIYQLPRILGFVIYSLVHTDYWFYFMALVCTFQAVLIATIQPYKKNIHNKIDVILMLIIAMLYASISAHASPYFSHIMEWTCVTFALLPLLYFGGLILFWFYNHTPWLRSRGSNIFPRQPLLRWGEFPDRIVNPNEYV